MSASDVAKRHRAPSRDQVLIRLPDVISPRLRPTFRERLVELGEVGERENRRGLGHLDGSGFARVPLFFDGVAPLNVDQMPLVERERAECRDQGVEPEGQGATRRRPSALTTAVPKIAASKSTNWSSNR